MEIRTKKILKAGGAVTCLLVGFVVALVYLTSFQGVVQQQTMPQKTWHLVVVGDIAVAAGASGIVNISIVKHNAWSGGGYNTNITRNASWYAFTETNNTEAGTNVPYNKRLDVICRVRWNKTHAYNSTSHVWNSAWVRGNISMTVFGLENQSMIEYNITNLGAPLNGNGFTYVYYNYVFNTSGSGFWINKSQRVKSCYFRGWAYY